MSDTPYLRDQTPDLVNTIILPALDRLNQVWERTFTPGETSHRSHTGELLASGDTLYCRSTSIPRELLNTLTACRRNLRFQSHQPESPMAAIDTCRVLINASMTAVRCAHALGFPLLRGGVRDTTTAVADTLRELSFWREGMFVHVYTGPVAPHQPNPAIKRMFELLYAAPTVVGPSVLHENDYNDFVRYAIRALPAISQSPLTSVERAALEIAIALGGRDAAVAAGPAAEEAWDADTWGARLTELLRDILAPNGSLSEPVGLRGVRSSRARDAILNLYRARPKMIPPAVSAVVDTLLTRVVHTCALTERATAPGDSHHLTVVLGVGDLVDISVPANTASHRGAILAAVAESAGYPRRWLKLVEPKEHDNTSRIRATIAAHPCWARDEEAGGVNYALSWTGPDADPDGARLCKEHKLDVWLDRRVCSALRAQFSDIDRITGPGYSAQDVVARLYSVPCLERVAINKRYLQRVVSEWGAGKARKGRGGCVSLVDVCGIGINTYKRIPTGVLTAVGRMTEEEAYDLSPANYRAKLAGYLKEYGRSTYGVSMALLPFYGRRRDIQSLYYSPSGFLPLSTDLTGGVADRAGMTPAGAEERCSTNTASL